jgi:uncharacterized membrane protein (UPF0136 family)
MIELTKYYYYLFGAFTILGGVMGYLKANSVASLVAGGVSGALLIFAGVLVSTKVQPALILGLIISLALAGRFIPAFFSKGGFMPSGLMSALSVIGAILTIITLIAPAAKR